MVSKFFRPKPPYTQAEIKLQQGIVAEAIRQRESVSHVSAEDRNRASTSVEVAQEILNFMLEETSRFNHG